MMSKLEFGEAVTVLVANNQLASLRVIERRGATVILCNEREFETAKKEGRRPKGVGFRTISIVENAEA